VAVMVPLLCLFLLAAVSGLPDTINIGEFSFTSMFFTRLFMLSVDPAMLSKGRMIVYIVKPR
jgi:hypothetical protein